MDKGSCDQEKCSLFCGCLAQSRQVENDCGGTDKYWHSYEAEAMAGIVNAQRLAMGLPMEGAAGRNGMKMSQLPMSSMSYPNAAIH